MTVPLSVAPVVVRLLAAWVVTLGAVAVGVGVAVAVAVAVGVDVAVAVGVEVAVAVSVDVAVAVTVAVGAAVAVAVGVDVAVAVGVGDGGVVSATAKINSPLMTDRDALVLAARPLPFTVRVPGVPVTLAEPLFAMSV